MCIRDRGFVTGLSEVQQSFDFALLGGDTVRTDGPLVASVTIYGEVPKGEMVKRSGANIGDDIWVTGVLGDAKLGCDHVLGQDITPKPKPDDLWGFEQAYWRPEIYLSLRQVLREKASAALDVSDGIIRDAGHIAKASEVGLTLKFEVLPISNAAENWAEQQENSMKSKQTLIGFGDDYQILFTSAPQHRQSWFDVSRERRLKLTHIGQVTQGQGVQCLDLQGKPISLKSGLSGYSHF